MKHRRRSSSDSTSNNLVHFHILKCVHIACFVIYSMIGRGLSLRAAPSEPKFSRHRRIFQAIERLLWTREQYPLVSFCDTPSQSVLVHPLHFYCFVFQRGIRVHLLCLLCVEYRVILSLESMSTISCSPINPHTSESFMFSISRNFCRAK
jgi:hypothetical protein